MTHLNKQPNRSACFYEGVLINLHYWRDWFGHHIDDIAALDQERHNVVKAILFSLELAECWVIACEVIEMFAPYMERRGYWNSWNQVLALALSQAQTIADLNMQAKLSGLMARLLQRQGRFKDSITYYGKAIRLSRNVGDLVGEARACSNLGYYYIEYDRWHRAEVLCYHALKIFRQIEHEHGQAHTENHLGLLYIRQGIWDKAQQHLENACQLWKLNQDDHGLMRGLINLSALYIEVEHPQRAINHCHQALQLAVSTGEKIEVGSIYDHLGLAYQLLGNLAEAEVYHLKAEQIFSTFGNIAACARSWHNIGKAYIRQKQWPAANAYLEKSYRVWHALAYKNDKIKTLLDMVEVQLMSGNWQQAKTYLDELEYQLLPDSQTRKSDQVMDRLHQYRCSLFEVDSCKLQRTDCWTFSS